MAKLEPRVITTGKTYQPVFAGKTEDDEKIIIYKNMVDDSYHVQREGGELWALEAGSEVTEWFNSDQEIYYVYINSPQLKTKATGSLWDLMEVQAR